MDQGLGGQKLEAFAAPAAAGAWVETHDPAVEGQGWLAPIQLQVVFVEQAGVGHTRAGLGLHGQAGQAFGLSSRTGGLDHDRGLCQQFGRERCQPVSKLMGIVE